MPSNPERDCIHIGAVTGRMAAPAVRSAPNGEKTFELLYLGDPRNVRDATAT